MNVEMVSIIDVVVEEVRRCGFKKFFLFGIKIMMEMLFYREVFEKKGF